MSIHEAKVFEVQDVKKHDNADTLDVVTVGSWTCCTRLGDFKPGDKAVFIEPDTLVDVSLSQFAFLAKDAKDGWTRIKAKRLRGVPSFGLLIHADTPWVVGFDAWKQLRLQHYDPPIRGANCGGQQASAPNVYHIKYDIESLRKYSDVLLEGEMVEITEKIHGANSRFVFHDNQLHVGSHTTWKVREETNLWWRAAIAEEMEYKLQDYPDHVFYGEVYGQVQDLRYGSANGDAAKIAIFDIMYEGRWLPVEAVRYICHKCRLATVPRLYVGPWAASCYSYADGMSTIPGANHLREGCVVKPLEPRYDKKLGRVILKLVSVDYLGRKQK